MTRKMEKINNNVIENMNILKECVLKIKREINGQEDAIK